jgi:hypothetical protein
MLNVKVARGISVILLTGADCTGSCKSNYHIEVVMAVDNKKKKKKKLN